jgi:nitronate monooxygenase
MSAKDKSSLLDFYNMLLEAERAGVKVLGELLSQVEGDDLQVLVKKFLRDEGINCRILISLIHDLGAEPSDKTGDFVEKVQALDNLEEKIDLLIRGQEWVARKIRQSRALVPVGSSYLFMEAIKVQHEENVDALKAYS